MKIIYTINGHEASWCVQERDKYELQRIMNDGIGIPADPMLDVLVFAAYMGEYNTFYRFYRDFVEEFLDPDELFDTEPIEYFNTVLQPMFEDDIKILDIEWGVFENRKRMKRSGKVLEDIDSGGDVDSDEYIGYSDEVNNAIYEVSKQVILDAYAAYGIKIPSFNILMRNGYMFPILNPQYIRIQGTILDALEYDGLNPSSATVNDVLEVLGNKSSNTYRALIKLAEPYVYAGISNLSKYGDARNYLKRNGVEIPNNIDEIVSNFGMLENKKENKMNKLSRMREAFEDASFDIADRFVVQARKVVNNIADNVSGIYADDEMSPHQEAWIDEVADAFKILKAGASKLRDGSITSCQFLDYIERFMAVTEDEDCTDDYLALWPIRKMFTSSCELEDSKWVESTRRSKLNKKRAIKEAVSRRAVSRRLREDGDKLSDYVDEEEVRDAFIGFAHDEIGENFDADFEDDIIDMMLEWFEPVMADVMDKPFREVAKMMGETGDAPSDPNDINIDDLAYAIWDKAAPDDYEDQINIAFC